MIVSELLSPLKALNSSPVIAITGASVCKSVMPIPIAVAYAIITVADSILIRVLFG